MHGLKFFGICCFSIPLAIALAITMKYKGNEAPIVRIVNPPAATAQID